MDLTGLQKELGLKKKPIPLPLKTIENVYSVGQKYDDERVRFIFYYLYLTGQRITEGLRTRRIDISEQVRDGNKILLVSSISLKNRTTPRRIIPIPVFGVEESMTKYVWEYMKSFGEDEVVIPWWSRTNVWNKLSNVKITIDAINPEKKTISEIEIKVFPHYLRHCRASHLPMYHNYDLYKLMQFFGWTSPKIASVYATLDWSTLAEPFWRGK